MPTIDAHRNPPPGSPSYPQGRERSDPHLHRESLFRIESDFSIPALDTMSWGRCIRNLRGGRGHYALRHAITALPSRTV